VIKITEMANSCSEANEDIIFRKLFAMRHFSLALIILFFSISCASQENEEVYKEIRPGAWQMDEYLPLLEGKNIGLVVNPSSTIGKTHLVDTLLSRGVLVKVIFGPEHGFRGDKYDGEKIDDSVDPQTGLPVISLYGSHRKPTTEDLEGLDLVIYDIQDVGARFYTYISTMHYVMEACAENNKAVMILDRPNPNGHYVDGPVLDSAFRSFVGMHPIPMVYGLTPGEAAKMINGENWLENGVRCDLTVIPNKNYDHNSRYELPVQPSPNLPNARSVELYPSLCLFEPTVISIGRGTPFPFQVVGYPDSTMGDFSFTPISIDGVSKYPKHQDVQCFGEDLRSEPVITGLDLNLLMKYFRLLGANEEFFRSPDYFDKLAGTDQVRLMMLEGKSLEEIRQSWNDDLTQYKSLRKKYLLYPDFE
jgi:uncharacterized protein YbbC (DUF1343 family)